MLSGIRLLSYYILHMVVQFIIGFITKLCLDITVSISAYTSSSMF